MVFYCLVEVFLFYSSLYTQEVFQEKPEVVNDTDSAATLPFKRARPVLPHFF